MTIARSCLSFWVGTGGASGLLGSLSGLPLLLLLFAAMYFFFIAPNQKKQRQWQSQLAALKPGDRITTSGGLRGTIVSLRDDTFILRTLPDGVKLECVKSAVAAITTEDPVKS